MNISCSLTGVFRLAVAPEKKKSGGRNFWSYYSKPLVFIGLPNNYKCLSKLSFFYWFYTPLSNWPFWLFFEFHVARFVSLCEHDCSSGLDAIDTVFLYCNRYFYPVTTPHPIGHDVRWDGSIWLWLCCHDPLTIWPDQTD